MTLESRTVFVTDKNNKPRKLTYDLERKQVKNINLRIRSDETLFVSASPHVAVKTILQAQYFLQEFCLYNSCL